MKVSIAVQGRFHVAEFASALSRRGALGHVISTAPATVFRRAGLPRGRIRALPELEVLRRLARRLPSAAGARMLEAASRRFATAVLRDLPEEPGVLLLFAGQAPGIIGPARERGWRVIIERSSAHVAEQRRLLIEEMERWELQVPVPGSEEVAREEREYELSDGISVPGSFAERSFRTRGFAASRLLRASLGVDVERFRPVAKDIVEQERPRRVAFCGNVSLQKGAHGLLGLDHPELARAELWLIGHVAPEMRPLLSEGRGSWGSVRVFGHVAQGRLPELFSSCDLLVHPAIHDGFGLVILQAMACELPVIASDHCGGPDVIRHGVDGEVLEAGDWSAFGERIAVALANREEFALMGRAARRSVIDRFTWDHHASRWLERLGALEFSPAEALP